MKFEAEIILFFQRIFNSASAINFFKIITFMGSFIGVGILFIIMISRDKKLSFIFLISGALSSVINLIIKTIISRDRPYIKYPEIKNHLYALGKSMPSSHSIIITLIFMYSLYMINKYIDKKWERAIFISLNFFISILVVISRMVLGQHYISDILVGIILGLLISYAGKKIYHKLNSDK